MTASGTTDEVKTAARPVPGRLRSAAPRGRQGHRRPLGDRRRHADRLDRRRTRAARRACRGWARRCWCGRWPTRLHLKFQRIQFTPDLMPADLIGTNVMLETPEGGRRVRVPARAGLRQPAAGRRDQPGHAQDPVGPARGDAGAVGDRRRHDAPAGAAVLRAGHPEPARDGGDLSAARGPARPVLLQAAGQVPDRRGDGDDPRPDDRGRRAAAPSPSSTASGSSSCRSWPGRSRSPTTCADTASPWSWPPTPRTPLATDMARRFVRYGSSPRGAQAIILAAKIRAILDHRYHVAREDLRACAHAGLAAPPDPQLRRPGREHPGRRHHRRHPRIGRDARGGGYSRWRISSAYGLASATRPWPYSTPIS